MATLAEIRTALAGQLAGIEGLRTHDRLPGQVNPPAAVVRRRSTTFGTSSDSDDTTLAVVVFVAWTDNLTAQDQLDAYLAPAGATSIRAAVEADPSLGGVVDYAVVTGAEQDEVLDYGGASYLTGTLTVEVG